MAIPYLSPAPADFPNKFGGDPIAFDKQMQDWLQWQSIRAAQDADLLVWLEDISGRAQAAIDAIEAYNPVTSAASAAVAVAAAEVASNAAVAAQAASNAAATVVSGSIKFSVFDTYADVTFPEGTGLVFVQHDETNDNTSTLYFFDGLALQWLPTVI